MAPKTRGWKGKAVTLNLKHQLYLALKVTPLVMCYFLPPCDEDTHFALFSLEPRPRSLALYHEEESDRLNLALLRLSRS
jgi:hypothetical protein